MPVSLPLSGRQVGQLTGAGDVVAVRVGGSSFAYEVIPLRVDRVADALSLFSSLSSAS